MALTNEQYEDIIRSFDRKRIAARAERERRRAVVLAAVPELKALDSETAGLAGSFVSRFADDKAEPSDFRRMFEDIAARKAALMREAGFAPDYIDDVYECSICHDTGFVNGSEKCTCFLKKESEILYEQSNLNILAKKISFELLTEDHLLQNGNEEDIRHFRGAKNAALEFVRDFDNTRKNLMFMGSVGTGKTALSVCIADELLKKGRQVLYFSSTSLFDLLAAIRFSRSQDSRGEHETPDDIYNCDLLVIDDLGTELTNAFVVEQFFTLLNERGMRDKRMIISTNLGLQELGDLYAERIMSRLVRDFAIYKLTGPDIRFREGM